MRLEGLRRRYPAVGLYALCLLGPVAFNQLTRELPSKAYRPGEPWYSRIWKADYWYQTLVTTGAPRPSADYVSLVRISENVEPPEWHSSNRCTHRPLMGKLVAEVARHKPMLVVVDYWYKPIPPTVCRGSDEPSRALLAGIAAASRDVPVIMARDSGAGDELKTVCGTALELESEGDNVLVSTLDFPKVAGQAGIRFGLSRFDLDTRRLPYAFRVFPDCSAAAARQGRELMTTISGAVADALNRTFPDALKEPGKHPFTSFLPEEAFPIYDASSLVCTPGGNDGPNGQPCPDAPTRQARLNQLRNRIVIIGERHYSDLHPTVIGTLTGMAVHANYIEAILSRRYFAPGRMWTQVLLTLLWFAMVELIFKQERLTPEAALAITVAASVVLTFVFFSFIVVYWGVYFAMVPPTVLAIFGKYVGRRMDRISKKCKSEPELQAKEK